MCFACCITKATHIHSEYVTLIAIPLQQWLHERPSMLRYTYITCVFPIIFSGNPLMLVFKLDKYSNNKNVSYKNDITGKIANYVVPRVKHKNSNPQCQPESEIWEYVLS